LVGLVTVVAYLSDADTQVAAAGLPARSVVCANPRFLAVKGAADLCAEWGFAEWVAGLAFLTLIVALLLPMIGLSSAALAGQNRSRLALIFRPTVLLCLVLLAGVMLAQAVILPSALFLVGSMVGRIPTGIIGGVALGSIYAAYISLRSILTIGRALRVDVVGLPAGPDQHASVHALVGRVAFDVGAELPRNVVVGPEPTFFATSASASLSGVPLPHGTTVYVSSTLGAVLSGEELRAVLAHEMAHFVGEDTLYSLKFAPAHRALAEANATLQSASGAGGVSGVATMPARATAALIAEAFERNQASISRHRELAADSVAATQASAPALVGALVKATIYGSAWGPLWQEVLSAASTFGDVPVAFRAAAVKLFDSNVQAVLEPLLGVQEGRPVSHLTHPTDTHPSLNDRAAALALPLSEASIRSFAAPSSNEYL